MVARRHLAPGGRMVVQVPPPLRPDAPPPGLRFLDAPVIEAARAFPPDRARAAYDVDPSTLDRPVIADHSRRGWRDE